MYCLLVKFSRRGFFFDTLCQNKDFFCRFVGHSLIFFFVVAAYFFLSYLSSLPETARDRSILLKLKSTLNLWLDKDFSSTSSGLIPYFWLFIPFIFSADFQIMVRVGTLAFCLLDMALILETLAFNSMIFCSVAKAFPPLTLVVNMVTLNLSFRS